MFKRKIKECPVPLNKAVEGRIKAGERFTLPYEGRCKFLETLNGNHYMNADICTICIEKNTMLSIIGCSTYASQRDEKNMRTNYKGLIKLFERFLKNASPIPYKESSIRMLSNDILFEYEYFGLEPKYINNRTILIASSSDSVRAIKNGKIVLADKDIPYSIAVVWEVNR